MDKPFFTVVIPTYNRALLLKRAVNSVINQSFHDFEILVIDDYSTDETMKTVISISDHRIKYILNNRSKGACGARNTGIFDAKGEWVAFLDDDDEWYPDKLKFQYDKISTMESTFGMVCTDYTIIKGANSKPLIIENRPSGWIKERLLYGYTIGCLSSTAVNSSILKKINGFDENFPSNQDWDLWLRISEKCKVTYVPKTLVKMYQEIRKDRIGQNKKAKLKGHILLKEKFKNEISKSLKLRQRHESLILIYAVHELEIKQILKSLPLSLTGIFVDLKNFLRTIRTIFIDFLRRDYCKN